MFRPRVSPRPTSPAASSWRYHQRWTACGLGRFFGYARIARFCLALGAASVVNLLRRIEEVVVRLRRTADVREIGAEEEPQLGKNWPAER
jgi:hypothetical protein